MPIPQKGDPDYVEYVLRTAQGGLIRQGVINEPRMLFDELTLPSGANGSAEIVNGNPGVFVNGEQFPLRITHMTATVRHPAPEVLLQTIGIRLNYHDQWYMNPRFLPVPVFGNKSTAAPEPASSATAHWDFVANGQPFVMSARDTLVVRVQLQVVPASTGAKLTANVTFEGIGTMSRRPYILNGQIDLDDLAAIDIPTANFRNDGVEPIAITDMTVNLSGPDLSSPQGFVSNLRFNVTQVGNGTGVRWFSGPVAPVNIQLAQATLAGVTTGRALVHQFPGDGFIWEPGEGLTLQAQPRVNNLLDGGNPVVLCLGLCGYIMVV